MHPHRHLRPGRRGQRDLPVDPGGPAPSVALRHLPHADQRVRPGPQHHLLQGPDLAQSCSRVALKILPPQPPYVLLVDPPVDGVPVEARPPVRSPSRCPTCPSVREARSASVVQRLTCPRQRPFGPGHQGRYPASYPRAAAWRSRHHVARFPVAFRPPAFASWASCPAAGFRSPHGRPTSSQPAPGPRRGFHVPHITRHDRVGCPLYPEASGVHTTGPIPPVAACRPSSGQALSPRSSSHPPELSITRHHQGFTRVHPSGLPLAW